MNIKKDAVEDIDGSRKVVEDGKCAADLVIGRCAASRVTIYSSFACLRASIAPLLTLPQTSENGRRR